MHFHVTYHRNTVHPSENWGNILELKCSPSHWFLISTLEERIKAEQHKEETAHIFRMELCYKMALSTYISSVNNCRRYYKIKIKWLNGQVVKRLKQHSVLENHTHKKNIYCQQSIVNQCPTIPQYLLGI